MWISNAVNTVDVFVMKTILQMDYLTQVKIVSLANKESSNFANYFQLCCISCISIILWHATIFWIPTIYSISKKKSDIDLQNHFLWFQIHFHFHQNIKWQQTHIPQKSKTTFVVSFSHIPHKNWKCHFVSEYVRKSVKNSQHTSKYLVFSNKRTSVFQ